MWNIITPRHMAVSVILLGFNDVICTALQNEEGPYKLVVHNTTKCTTEPAWFKTNVTSYTNNGESLLRGSFVVKRELKNVKFRIQASLHTGKLKVFDIKNKNCQHPIVQQVLDTIGVQFNRQKCTMKPASSKFNNLNINTIAHTVVKTVWYGGITIRWEITIPTHRLMCLDINLQILELKDVNL